MNRPIAPPLALAGSLFSTKALIRTSGKKNICLLYHLVADDAPLHIKHLYRPRNTTEFSADIDFLSKHFNFVSTEGLGHNTNSAGRPGLHLSFDDGLKECYDIIRPLLLQKGIPATFFVNPVFIDNKDMFHGHKASLLLEAYRQNKRPLQQESGEPVSETTFFKMMHSEQGQSPAFYGHFAGQLGVNFVAYLQQQKPYLSLEQVRQLKNDGFEMGGHTLTHALLNSLPESGRMDEIIGSLEWLRDNDITWHGYFAFPFHDIGIGASTFVKMKAWGIEQSFGTSGMKEDSVAGHYHRISFEDSGKKASALLKMELLKYILQKSLGKHKITRN